MDKTFTVAGTSIKKGEKTNRFANGTANARAKVLEKDNHSEIQLFDLPSPMTKEEAILWLTNNSNATPVSLTAATPKEPKTTPRLNREPPNKTNKSTPTFIPGATATQEIMQSPVARAVFESGLAEMQVTAEQEAEAMELHKVSVIDFLTWTQMSVQSRNEFRATVLHCPKVKAA